MPNEFSGKYSDIDNNVELFLTLITTLVLVLDYLQAVRKYICEQSEISTVT
jgi:hypothetical protein